GRSKARGTASRGRAAAEQAVAAAEQAVAAAEQAVAADRAGITAFRGSTAARPARRLNFGVRRRRRMDMRPTFCVVVPALLGLAIAGTGGGHEPPQPDDKPKVVREQVQGQWRHPGEKLLRITGRVKVLDAHTLLFEDGTEVNINGGMDAPDLGQQGLIGDTLYPCGKEAAAFLEQLIDG